MKSIRITVSDDQLQEIAENFAKEMDIGFVSTPEKGCYNCQWYTFFDGVCCNADSEWGAAFRNEADICEKWEER